MCSRCADITTNLTVQPEIAALRPSLTLPNGFYLLPGRIVTDCVCWLNSTVDASTTAFHVAGSVLADITSIGGDADSPYAIECLLQTCVQLYIGSVVGGHIVENEISAWTNDSNISISELEENSEELCPGRLDLCYDQEFYGAWIFPANPQSTLFRFSALTGNIMWTLILDMFHGTYGFETNGGGDDPEDQLETASESIPTQYMYWLQKLASGNATISMEEAVQSYTQTLSVSMRSDVDWPRELVNSTATKMITTYKVTWSWLAFPFALVFGTLSFIVLMIVRTRKERLILWRNSITATMIHRLDVETRREVCARAEISRADKACVGS